MKLGCSNCGAAGAKKADCCGQRLCVKCGDSVRNHDCKRAKEIAAIASDPKKLRQWRAENSPEEAMTTQVIAALNALPGITVWRTKRRQGARASDDNDGVPDVSGFAAPDGRAIFVEAKHTHPDSCACASCAAQADFASRARGAGCVVVLRARTVTAAVDGVRLGLARARGQAGAAA